MTVQQILLTDFLSQCGAGLMERLESTAPPKFNPQTIVPNRNELLCKQARKPFETQQTAIHAVSNLLLDFHEPAAVINGEMGTGKTLMGISVANVLHYEGFSRCLVICPPHLVYKWRREIKQTIPDAKVWILNGPDTLMKLIQLRALKLKPEQPEFFVMGRVRMRMGFDWQPSFVCRNEIVTPEEHFDGEPQRSYRVRMAACPDCGAYIKTPKNDRVPFISAHEFLSEKRQKCECGSALWQLVSKRQSRSKFDMIKESLKTLPTIGEKRATGLIDSFGEDMLGSMLQDNFDEFVNLQNDAGDFVFTDNQAKRIERAMANSEFSFGSGGYQPTEFIKRYLPQGFFGLLIADEGHEYKNEGSAQGQAMGVLARKCSKVILLTGTLMGGYADDLFYLLWRINPRMMMDEGFAYNTKNSLGMASMSYMRQYGVLKDIYVSTDDSSHKTARGSRTTHRVSKAPGFSPVGVMRHVLPMTVFVRLKDLGENVLPSYTESVIEVEMEDKQREHYAKLSLILTSALRKALASGDRTLLGVVLNALLAWPDCCFVEQTIVHPKFKNELAYTPIIFDDDEPSPKEQELLNLCLSRKAQGRKVLVYTTYTQTRDTTARLKRMLDAHGFNVAVLKSSVDASKREDWLLDQVDRGVEVVITNPELVKTGLDMLQFPTIVFMQTGFNVYTVQQAARRSWRIGQTEAVEVLFLGYAKSAQTECLRLMAAKIAVSQSTSGEMPDSGLDILNQEDDNIEAALAKQLLEDPRKMNDVRSSSTQATHFAEAQESVRVTMDQIFKELGEPEWDGKASDHDIHVLLSDRFKDHQLDSDVEDPIVLAKLFDFAGSGKWWVTEYDPKTNLGFGYVTGLVEDEWGYFSINEMKGLVTFGKPCIEFDLHFKPTNFSIIKARQFLA